MKILSLFQKLSKRQHDQQEAIWELLQTELHYIQSLRVITDVSYMSMYMYLFVT